MIKPETRHGVLIVVVLTLAAIAALAVFGVAGTVGTTLANGVGTLVGWQRFFLWAYLAAIGVILLFPERFHITAAQWVGFGLSVWALSAVLQMFVPSAEAFTRAVNGNGGGYLGYLIHYPLQTALGPWAAGLIIVALLIIGLLILFNTTLQSLVRQGTWPSRLLLKIRQLWWQRQLSRAQAEEPDQAADAPTFERQDVATEAPTGEPDAPVAEDEYVPLPPKPAKREKRQIVIPLDLLDISSSQPTSGNIDVNKERIRKTLETFGIPVEMSDVHVGPTVTQFTLKPAEGVRLSQIASLGNDLALALAAHPIRIEAPIPGKSLVGIEVPNQSVAIVNLRDILGSDGFKSRKSDLTFSLGKDVSGQPWVTNLDPLPHLLIAGATGSGKSVQINGLILSLLYSNSPDDLKLILVDPKRVELSMYNDIPHLLTPVITDTTKTINALRWVVSEMDRRYQVLQNAGKRNIATYRKEVSDDLPYIVVVIDELADLMSVAAKEVEGAIVRLAQMARAVGIHLVLATQRPSVDVITGLIKANVTARIAFSVASQVDSRTILDMSGAERLLGKGDMLFVSAELSKPKRLQGAYVSEKEVERVVQFLKSRGKPDYMTDIVDKPAPQLGGSMEDLGDDELLTQAKEVIIQAGKASASLLQRRLRVGYARAARILDLLEEEGFIGPGEGAKPREVYGQSNGGAASLGIPPEHDGPPDRPDVDEPEPGEPEATDDDSTRTA
ncbi:MAG: DNA translocase FtsK [Candidatus Kerfeldbacteria bacterium]|nr:DNA translocase FtsK [Candidatus Kerfeldbacteria bacterium]